MVENQLNPAPEELDVGQPADPLAERIARGEPVGWGGPSWRRARRRAMRVVAWIGLIVIVAGGLATTLTWIIL